MIPFAVLLGLVGTVLVGYAVRGLWISRPDPPLGDCDMPSPDGQPCSGTLGHVGWHHRDELEWFGDAWMLPTSTIAAPSVPPNRDWIEFDRGPNPLKVLGLIVGIPAAGIAVMVGSLVVAHIANEPPPPDPHAHCAMSSATVNALNPYCPDSPDYHPPKGTR
jgi:hypothetical protein